MKRLGKVKIEWSSSFAYAIGLIASDGNLSSDGRHIILTSKDREMVDNFKMCLGLKNKIGCRARSGFSERKYFVVQFGDKNFYEFLLGVGLTPAKSKTISSLEIDDRYFADFLRGVLDGDGNINIFKHPESKHPQLRVRFFSASNDFLNWIQKKNKEFLNIRGFQREMNREIELAYAKADSVKLLNFLYHKECVYFLKRKHKKALPFLEK